MRRSSAGRACTIESSGRGSGKSLVPDMARRIDEETKRLLKQRAVEATIRRENAAVAERVAVGDEAVRCGVEQEPQHGAVLGEGADAREASGEP